MEIKAVMNTIGIFAGKQKDYNVLLLSLLYDNGPLTAWELTSKVTKVGRQSLHATFNKRLRNLEKKGYVRRKARKWLLSFKGIIAVLLIQPEPKTWNPKWTELFKKSAMKIEEYANPILGMEKTTIQNALKSLGLYLDNFDAWVGLSNKVKSLMENGVINLDVINEKTLLGIVIMETMTLEELSDLWKPKL
jgi:predicted transcriptional regulator